MRLMTLAAISALLLTGCTESSADSDATQFAMDACEIVVSSDGAATFTGDRTELADPYHETEANVAAWRLLAESASSAAALDPAFAILRDAIAAVYQVKRSAVDLRQDTYINMQDIESEIAFRQQFSSDLINKHNDGLYTWRIECSALATRISK
jgi:hypothetical protein